MSDMISFNVTYDPRGDVLYITTKSVAATRGIEDRHGIVWRYGPGGELIGATIVDFVDLWSSKEPDLARELASHFEIPIHQALNVVEQAMEGRKS